MNLPIASLTLKIAQKHQDDLDELIRKIAELEAKGPSQMWREELKNLNV
jgi:hypothetical protein